MKVDIAIKETKDYAGELEGIDDINSPEDEEWARIINEKFVHNEKGVTLRLKGGSGSGNFGHPGREGEVGGSAPEGGGGSTPKDVPLTTWTEARGDIVLLDSYDDVKETSFGKGYFIMPNGKIIDVSLDLTGQPEEGSQQDDHVGMIVASGAYELFGLTKSQAKALGNTFGKGRERQYDQPIEEFNEAMEAVTAIRNNAIRVREYKNEVDIDTPKIDVPTLRRLQRLFDTKVLGVPSGKTLVWSDAEYSTTTASLEEFLDAKYVVNGVLKEQKNVTLRLKEDK
jgi:hypothetical protein